MSKPSAHRATPYLVLAISLAVTLIGATYASKRNFDQVVDLQRSRVSEALENRLRLLRGVEGFFAARSGIPPEEFQRYTAHLKTDGAYPDVSSIGYSARQLTDESDYYLLSYAEPSASENYPELDLFANPVLRPALERARDSGLPAISSRWDRDSKTSVFMICLPAYGPAASLETLEGRRGAIEGFVFGFIRPDIFVPAVLGAQPAEVGLRIFSGQRTDPASILHSSDGVSGAGPQFSARGSIDVSGSPWTLLFTAPIAGFSVRQPAFVLLLCIGGIVSLVLFVATRSNTIARVAAENRAEQLRRSKEIEERLNVQLKQHRTKLKELISQMPGVVWELHGQPGTTLRTVFISDFVEKMLGYAVAEWLETPGFWLAIVHPEDRDRLAREIERLFETGDGRSKFRWIARDGRTVWVETHAAVILDERSQPTGMRGVTMDITARHRTEETLRDREARLQIALSAARMASWHCDLVTGTLIWDDSPYSWTDFVKRVHVEDQPAVRNAVDHALQERHDLDIEFRVVRPDSTIRWLTLKAKVFQGDDGRPAYITGVSVDITDRRNSAEALRASEERYRLAARATNDAIWDWDLETGLVQWNEGIRTLFGYGTEQAGSDIKWRWDQIHPDDRERVVSGINAVIEGGGRFWSDEYRFRCANGSYSTVTDRAYIEQNESGRAVRLIAAMTDVTRLKQAEREREQLLRLEQTARKQAESANRLKDEFLATLSHELRTPITPILGWTHLLRNRATTPADLERGLTVIEQNARAQAKLVEDLLDVSRIVTGKMQLKIQTVQIQQILQAAIDSMQPAADAKKVRIEAAENLPLQIAADPDRLQQVVWNLLSNAIKFTQEGGVIRISSERIDSEVRIVVRDNGEGIDPAFLPHVFDRFSQADSTNMRVHGGLGAGLAIVRYIVELHGGQVAVDSRGKGRGATFTVSLPAKADEPPPKPKRSRRLAKAISTLKGLRLLLVEDEADARDLLALVLQHEGAVVTAVASAEEALAILAQEPPDILVSDIAMPGENGYDLLEKLREMERQQGRSPIPAIALTAFARDEDRKAALQSGFDAHLSKPVESVNLIAAILKVVSKRLDKTG